MSVKAFGSSHARRVNAVPVRPCERWLCEEAALPASLLGPVECCALASFAVICACVGMMRKSYPNEKRRRGTGPNSGVFQEIWERNGSLKTSIQHGSKRFVVS